MSYVDLHLHLLPGVDDGPADEAASLRHAATIAAAGVHEATVTPHVGHPYFHFDVASIPDRVRALQDALDREDIALTLHPGGELHPARAAELTAAELAVVAQGPPGARWLLFEVPFAGIDHDWLATCAHLRAQGYGLVIGHPERAANLLDDGLALLRGELTAGAVLQVNVCSLLGRHGPEARDGARRLVRSGLAYLLASDGHGGTRGHTLADGRPLVRALGASAVQSWQMTQSNPRFLLHHGIPAAPPHATRRTARTADQRRIAAALATARRRR
jgi:protein-tyrosine phosphatase